MSSGMGMRCKRGGRRAGASTQHSAGTLLLCATVASAQYSWVKSVFSVFSVNSEVNEGVNYSWVNLTWKFNSVTFSLKITVSHWWLGGVVALNLWHIWLAVLSGWAKSYYVLIVTCYCSLIIFNVTFLLLINNFLWLQAYKCNWMLWALERQKWVGWVRWSELRNS